MVVDSGSNDGTAEFVRELGVEVIDFRWNGQFPKKRNWFLRNHVPDTKWVLFLDADELLTTNFKQEVKTQLSQTDKVGFWLSYTRYFMGKRLKGGYPFRKLALFRVGAGEYEQIQEDLWSNLDMEVHEHPILKGDAGVIRSKIEHQDFRSIHHYVSKHNEYSSWEAHRFLNSLQEKRHNGKWTVLQKIKYALLSGPLLGPIYFISTYVFMGGFRDGARGLAFAILKMSYFTEVYCKIRELRHVEEQELTSPH